MCLLAIVCVYIYIYFCLFVCFVFLDKGLFRTSAHLLIKFLDIELYEPFIYFG